MPADDRLDAARVARVVGALAVGERDPEHSLCAAVVGVVGVSAAGVVLMSGGRVLGNVCVSDRIAEAVEEVQYTLGEGPGVEAWQTKEPVLVPDLARVDVVRWSGFREGALATGVRAAFGFPLLVGKSCVGALDLYQYRSGSLAGDQLANAIVVAHVVARTVVGWQSTAGDGSVAWQLEQVPAHRAAVHQASGMVSVQAGIVVGDALTLLRAYAFAEGRPISDVVADVLDRRLRFDEDRPDRAL